MNEHIDILLTTAKFASRDNQWASLATHTLSMGYNISMVGYYGYQLGSLNAMNQVSVQGQCVVPNPATIEQIQRLKQERNKYCVLCLLDVIGLILNAVDSFQGSRR